MKQLKMSGQLLHLWTAEAFMSSEQLRDCKQTIILPKKKDQMSAALCHTNTRLRGA